MALDSFVWGGNTGQRVSPDEVANYRNVANALRNRRTARTPQNPWEGLNAVAQALSERAWRNQAREAEEAGQASAAEAYQSMLGGDPGVSDIAGFLGNEWASEGQQAVAQALLGRAVEPEDPWANTKVINGQLVTMGPDGPQVIGDYNRKEPISVGGVLVDPDTYEPVFDSRQSEDSGFTLGSGQARFDAQGNVIARGPEEAQPPTEYEFMNIDGTLVRVDPRSGQMQLLGQFAQSDLSAAEEKVSRIQELGYTRERAIEIADLTRLAQDETGRQRPVRIDTGEWLEPAGGAAGAQQGGGVSAPQVAPQGGMSQAPAGGPMDQAQQQQSQPSYSIIPEGTDAEQALSIGGQLRGTANAISDFFTGEARFEEQEQAASAFNSLSTNTILALQEPVAGRPNVFTLERLDELTIRPGMGRSQAASRARQMQNMMQSEMQRINDQVLQNPNQWEPEEVRTAQRNYNQLRALMDSYRDISESLSQTEQEGRPPLESFERPYN